MTYYKNSNFEDTRSLFTKRMVYNADVQDFKTNYPNFVDFNFAEKFLYGRVDRQHIPMVYRIALDPIDAGGAMSEKMRYSKIALKYFGREGIEAQTQNLAALNFVVDAFRDLAKHFQVCATKGLIDASDPFLSNLKVYNAYQDPIKMYNSYRDSYFRGIVKSFKRQNVKIKNFDEFSVRMLDFLLQSTAAMPVTMPAFIKSKMCPIAVSGLSIEIANLDAASDKEKIDKFVASNNWEFYLNACKQHGFMVDRMVPWRLVADIGSSQMLNYAAEYDSSLTDLLIDNYYIQCHRSYFSDYFMTDMGKLYNMCTQSYIGESRICNGKIVNDYIKPQTLDSALKETRRAEFFIAMYAQIRMTEEETTYSEHEKEKILSDITDIMIYGSGKDSLTKVMKAIDYFERLLSKTFDYRGSMSYISEIEKPARLAAEGEGTSESTTTSGGSGGGY